ncbi:MAG: recombinase family protein [Gemmatimonadetes bacterium]|nr:recombinase family protein [Gemmatimonadota bacterium]
MSELRAIAYVRVSSDDQVRDGLSLDAQEAKLRAYAVARDLELVEVVRDEGLSAKNLKRPGIERLITACRAREVGAILVMKLDRLSRRTRDLLYLIEDVLEANGVTLHSLHETVDTSCASGRFFLRIMGALSEMERETIIERTRAALDFKRQNGGLTSHPPYGFSPNGRRGKMVPVPDELNVVQRILDEWRHGGTYAGIARQLHSQGVRTKRGARWHASTVRGIVQRQGWYTRVLSAS